MICRKRTNYRHLRQTAVSTLGEYGSCFRLFTYWHTLTIVICLTAVAFSDSASGQDPIVEHLEAAQTLELYKESSVLSFKSKQSDVYLFDVRNGVERRMTNSALWEESPDLSDDGNFLAFTTSNSLCVLDLQANKYLLELDARFYSNPRWIRGKEKLVVSRRGEQVVPSADRLIRDEGLLAMNPDGTGEEVLQDRRYRVWPFECHQTEARIAFVRERVSDGLRELCVMTYGASENPKVIRAFEKEMHPQTIHWLPGGQRLAVLVLGTGDSHGEPNGRDNTVFSVDLRTGALEKLFQAPVSEGDFAISAETGRIAIADYVTPFGWVMEKNFELPEMIVTSGREFRWHKGDEFVIYGAPRYPDELWEKLKVGIPLPDKRMYILLEKGGVACLSDPENEHSLYVRSENILQNGMPISILVDVSLEEAQAHIDLHDKGVKLGQNGPVFENELRVKPINDLEN